MGKTYTLGCIVVGLLSLLPVPFEPQFVLSVLDVAVSALLFFSAYENYANPNPFSNKGISRKMLTWFFIFFLITVGLAMEDVDAATISAMPCLILLLSWRWFDNTLDIE